MKTLTRPQGVRSEGTGKDRADIDGQSCTCKWRTAHRGHAIQIVRQDTSLPNCRKLSKLTTSCKGCRCSVVLLPSNRQVCWPLEHACEGLSPGSGPGKGAHSINAMLACVMMHCYNTAVDATLLSCWPLDAPLSMFCRPKNLNPIAPGCAHLCILVGVALADGLLALDGHQPIVAQLEAVGGGVHLGRLP